MPLMHCPHCGAENFTMEGWEDLDHCMSCGKPLGKPIMDPLDTTEYVARRGRAGRGHRESKGQNARRPRRA
jgi:hypothetical protein